MPKGRVSTLAESLNTLSLEQLNALNSEITMLARAGVPIESGLRKFARSGNKASNRAAERISTRLDEGQSLAESIRKENGQFPDVYATVVESGVRSGRLTVGLEAITEFAQDFIELRRGLFQAILYPLITAIAAYSLFVVFVAHTVNRLTSYQDLIGQRTGRALQILQWLAENIAVWSWIPPAIFLLAAMAWLSSGRANAFSMSGPSRLMMLVPGVGRAVRCFRHSMFTRLAAVLLENSVPLHDALPLAAGGCGVGLKKAAFAFAKADEAGDRSAVVDKDTVGMQPLLRWILRRQQAGPQLIKNLQTVSKSYYEKGQVTLRWIRLAAPLFFMFFVGGGLTAIYALSLFLPITDMMQQLSEAAI